MEAGTEAGMVAGTVAEIRGRERGGAVHTTPEELEETMSTTLCP